jgi:hypothetical protein
MGNAEVTEYSIHPCLGRDTRDSFQPALSPLNALIGGVDLHEPKLLKLTGGRARVSKRYREWTPNIAPLSH